MIRDSLAPEAGTAADLVYNGSIFRWMQRGSLMASANAGWDVGGSLPRWVKLVRAGNNLTGYISVDGTTWTFHQTVTIAMTNPVYVGMFASSSSASTTATATFDNVIVTQP